MVFTVKIIDMQEGIVVDSIDHVAVEPAEMIADRAPGKDGASLHIDDSDVTLIIFEGDERAVFADLEALRGGVDGLLKENREIGLF